MRAVTLPLLLLVGCGDAEPDWRAASLGDLLRAIEARHGSERLLPDEPLQELWSRPRGPTIDELLRIARRPGDDLAVVAADVVAGLAFTLRFPGDGDAPVEDAVKRAVADTLLALLETGDLDSRARVLLALGMAWRHLDPGPPPPIVTTTLTELLRSDVRDHRSCAILTVMWNRPAAAAVADALLAAAATERDESLRRFLAWTLARGDVRADDAAALLLAMLASDDADVRCQAANALGDLGRETPAIVAALRGRFADPREPCSVRAAAAWALAAVLTDPTTAEEVLERVLGAPSLFRGYTDREARPMALGRLAAAARRGSSVQATARRQLELVVEQDEPAALLGWCGLVRIAIAVEDEALGHACVAALRAALPDVVRAGADDWQHAALLATGHRETIDALVDLAQWPAMQVEPGELRVVLDRALGHELTWVRERAREQLARLEAGR